MALPRFVVMKSNYNNKYLRYRNEEDPLHGSLQFSGEEFVSPFTKFEVEMGKKGSGLVHIRCCYNNKYWGIGSEDHKWIVAAADEPEEDRSKWSCTLFEPVFLDQDAKTLRFRHVNLGSFACLYTESVHESCLYAGPLPNKDDSDSCFVFSIVDWESVPLLPKHVTFKGDNGKFLGAQWINGYAFLQFAWDDIADPKVANEVFTAPDGSIRIKSDYFGKFWALSPDWILACDDDTTEDNPRTSFFPVKLDGNVIALRNLGSNNYCQRFTITAVDCLYAKEPIIYPEARLEVHEPVLSRTIYNVYFRIDDARIYNRSLLTTATQVAVNESQEISTVKLKFSHTETRTSVWNSNTSWKLGAKTTIQAKIPFIVDGKVEISGEFAKGSQWGGTHTSTNQVETEHVVTVPRMSLKKVRMLVTKCSCDVPFSYSQSDVLNNGNRKILRMDDGVFTGDNYEIKFDSSEAVDVGVI